MKCTLVEPPSADGDDECGTDGKTAGGGSDGCDSECSLEEQGMKMRQRAAFEKTRAKIERNLHVLKPSVTAVSQLGQEMLGGVQIMDFDSPR